MCWYLVEIKLFDIENEIEDKNITLKLYRALKVLFMKLTMVNETSIL